MKRNNHFIPLTQPFDLVDYAMPSKSFPFVVVCYPCDGDESVPYSDFVRCSSQSEAMAARKKFNEVYHDCYCFLITLI